MEVGKSSQQQEWHNSINRGLTGKNNKNNKIFSIINRKCSNRINKLSMNYSKLSHIYHNKNLIFKRLSDFSLRKSKSKKNLK